MSIDNPLYSAVCHAMGFDQLSVMQIETHEKMSAGRDVLVLSPTGSGKTVAFLLGITSATLVIVPSRELAQQVADVARALPHIERVVCCYGGHDMRTEQSMLSTVDPAKVVLLVGTPGRILDHLQRGNIEGKWFQRLIIDEYDKCLEMGFTDEMKAIIEQLTVLGQRVLTSATHAVPIAHWVGMHDWETIATEVRLKATVEDSSEEARLQLYQLKSPVSDKLETLRQLLFSLPREASVIVFSGYRESSERIAHYLVDQGIPCALYHGGLEQPMRDKALVRFRGQSIRVLVSTDLASRGLDIPEVSHVIHYHLPADQETDTHRNGRTARAGASGDAIYIVGPEEMLPAWLDDKIPYFRMSRSLPDVSLFAPVYETIYIGRGKREKISKGDVVGFFTKQGGLTAADLGRIDLFDHCAYCAVRREVVDEMLSRVRGLKIKGQKTHYLVVQGS